MNENLTILKKGLLLIAVPFLFQAVFLGLLLETSADVERAQKWALHTKEVIARVEGTYRKMVEAHSGVRGLMLTDDRTFYEVAERSLRQVPGELAALQGLVADSDRQRAGVGAIAERSAALIEWQEATSALMLAGRRDEAIAQVKDLSGKRRLDEVRAAIDAFLAEENRLDAERMATLRGTVRRQTWALAAGGLMAVLGGAALAIVFGRGISRRFDALAENAARLTEGKELLRPIEGRDEIAQVDRAFRGMAQAIAEKNRENEMFIYSVSHDLRSPLVNLQGFSQELRLAAGELRGILDSAGLPEPTRAHALALVDQDIRGSIQFIQTAVARLSAIIDALLRLSRAGRVEYSRQPVDVAAAVRRIIDALNATIAERGARVEVVGTLPAAWGDPTAVEQVFANLISNAVNYLDPARPGIIEVGALQPGPGPSRTYYVKDNGRGISEASMGKLFQAFQRFHAGAAQGEGIGLAMVRRIVERHGGRIRAESRPDVGTTFFVELPGGPPEAGAGELDRAYQGQEAFV